MELNRVRAYLLTFSGMTILYTLRAGYSYAKPYIMQQYSINNLFISVVDAFQFIGQALAFMIKYKMGYEYTIGEFMKNGMLMCIFYLLMPIIPLIYHDPTSFYSLLLLSCGLFGFLQFCFQPTLSKQMNKYYDKEQDQFLFSCWDSGRHLGRALGFFFMELQMINIGFGWNTSLIILIGIQMVDIAAIYYYCGIKEPPSIREETRRLTQQQIAQDPDQLWSDFLFACKHWMIYPPTRYYILLICMHKALSYNFIHWLSTYLFSYNYIQLAGQASLVFVIPIYCGNFLIGKMYEYSADTEETFKYSQVFLITTGIISTAGFVLLTVSSHLNYIQFIVIIMIEGFVQGGSFNILRINLDLCDYFSQRQKDMFNTFTNGAVYLSAGVVSLAIGITLHIRTSLKVVHPEVGIFEVMKIVSIFGLLFLGLWIIAIYDKMDRQNEQTELQSLALRDRDSFVQRESFLNRDSFVSP